MVGRTLPSFSRLISLLSVGLCLSACSPGVATEPKNSTAGPSASTPTPEPTPKPTSTPTPGPTPQPGIDATPPIVISVSPPNTAMGARLDIIFATFSEDIDPKSVTRFSFGVGGGPTNTVVGDLNIKGKVVTFTPNPPLAFGASYAVKLTTDIQDLAGNFLAEDFIWRFNTGKQLALHSSGNHTCARRVSGELKCWG